tara:strand:- start:62 stop:232 length:171 start_codon:yes stop_codon:yes gene_type:complete
MKITNIDIETFKGTIKGDLVVYEKGTDPKDGVILYGFDEVGEFDILFTNPQYCMME